MDIAEGKLRLLDTWIFPAAQNLFLMTIYR